MRTLLDIAIDWPMPLVWLLFAALILAMRGRGRALLIVAAVLFVLSAVPIVGRALLAPLAHGAVSAEAAAAGDAAVILVPTAGSFRDAGGRWWPEDGSIRRLAAALAIQERLGLPLLVGGGAPYADQPTEAETVVQLVAPGRADVRVAGAGRDSAESAAAVAAALPGATCRVMLLTDASHILRMRAALRQAGCTVVASLLPPRLDPAGVPQPDRLGWRDFVPADSGLDTTAAALHEYVGIAWYLLSGRIDINDL